MQVYYNLKKNYLFETRKSDLSAFNDLLNSEYINEEKNSLLNNIVEKAKHKTPEEYLEKRKQNPTSEEKPLLIQPIETSSQPKETTLNNNEESDLEKQILSNIAFSFVK